jgi:acetoin utilization deacetylase AcuC-like enzyme
LNSSGHYNDPFTVNVVPRAARPVPLAHKCVLNSDPTLMATAFHYDPLYLEHYAGDGHPERPERLASTIAHLRQQPWFDSLIPLAATPADETQIHPIHAPEYVTRARHACEAGHSYLDVPDVGISARSYDAATLAAGSAIAMADAVVERRVRNAFGLSRPPGHHAEASLALGFCLFNNVAVAARHMQSQHGLDKVLILDWDVHHGNGTQHSFESDPSVMYVSLHQYPFYPGTGAASETGEGAGGGATLNCPMKAGATDADYEHAFMTRILPAVDKFAPQAVILSAGFDAHQADPLAEIALSTEFYGWMTQRMLEVADKHAGGRLMSILEGGYSLDALPLCVAEHVRHLCGAAQPTK